jgi:squalene-hopene/tetraprenyl-beta-curcumene cyclase
MMPAMNISQALSAFTGQNIGAGKIERVRRGFRAWLLLGLCISLITSLVVMTLAAAKRPQDEAVLREAVKFLREEQIVPGGKTPSGQNIAEGNAFIGGVSYGNHGRPDLSNVGMWMEAMHESGVGGEDPAMQRALTFLKQVQNYRDDDTNPVFLAEPGFLRQEQAANAQPKAAADSATQADQAEYDGGFIYAVNCKDGRFVRESNAGESDRGLRSYGSMTYTGFKSMLYANLQPRDKRVKAAYDWIRGHWQLDANPNMPGAQSRQGLVYYYQVFGKALRVWGESVIVDSQGFGHNWRHELAEHLAKEQEADGSWTNAADRWMEGNPVLVTSYACMALQDVLAQ